MQVLRIILTIIFAIDCIALTTVVLMQEGKQQGLGSIAGVADTYWGRNKGRSMEGGLVKATTIMAVLFFVLAPCIKYYLLRMIWSKKETLLYIRKSAFFFRFL